MKLVARVIGTWMIALALILIVVDGTKSLAANQPVMTSLASYWQGFDMASWAAVQGLIASYLEPFAVGDLAEAILSVPAFAVSGGLGLIALFFGRKRRKPVFADPI